MSKLFALCRLGRDASLNYTQDGTAVANLNLAYNYGRKQDDGQRPTQWVQGSLWGKRAEALVQYLTKGTAVAVTVSDVHIEHFNKSDGGVGTALKARVDDIEFAGGGQQTEQPRQQAADYQQASQSFQQPGGGASDQSEYFGDDPDDPIPFIRAARGIEP